MATKKAKLNRADMNKRAFEALAAIEVETYGEFLVYPDVDTISKTNRAKIGGDILDVFNVLVSIRQKRGKGRC